ncbi:putative protein OS=Streptomyces aurantiogriseus OX=66870 GN=GCM10010251_87240 PE=4 SV=1 [Streptomyces aurantiogriseus]|uniref:Uncharacterized protein n=1 Tax=Streptomyces aurantiogriseus TaxID=66870 RepID=A0A918KZF9_9ACTN|nr:hypothetical protein GCM10010251_87240 [Streptomyces aurantiogriseus]
MNRRDGRGEPGRGQPSVHHLGADDPTASHGRSQNSGFSSTATGNRSRFTGLPSPLTKAPEDLCRSGFELWEDVREGAWPTYPCRTSQAGTVGKRPSPRPARRPSLGLG